MHDLEQVALALQDYFGATELTGYVRGKTRIRNALMHLFDLSAVRAEELVERMHARGFLRYTGDPHGLDKGRDPWLVRPRPPSVGSRFDSTP